jgi:hypothetical protein
MNSPRETNSNAYQTRRDIEDLERQLERKRHELTVAENTCRHEWGPVTYDPITLFPAGEYGDEPGTMGVDYRRKQWYPATMQDAWSRTCKRCGKKEQTTRTEEHVTKTPKF